jgi:hypothetical protein
MYGGVYKISCNKYAKQYPGSRTIRDETPKEQIGEKCSDLWRFTNDSDLFEAKQ